MGMDARIYVKTTDGKEPVLVYPLPNGCTIFEVDSIYDLEDVATHEVDQAWRYYSPGYERGPWPDIRAVLVALSAAPNVENIFYISDHHDLDGGTEPFTQERLKEYDEHYARYGHEPYYSKFKK